MDDLGLHVDIEVALRENEEGLKEPSFGFKITRRSSRLHHLFGQQELDFEKFGPSTRLEDYYWLSAYR